MQRAEYLSCHGHQSGGEAWSQAWRLRLGWLVDSPAASYPGILARLQVVRQRSGPGPRLPAGTGHLGLAAGLARPERGTVRGDRGERLKSQTINDDHAGPDLAICGRRRPAMLRRGRH
jgi:hypothetical protein